MAFKTFGIDGLGVYQLVCQGAMCVVAIRTTHLTPADGMVGLAQQLRPDAFVTLPAGRFLSLIQKVGGIVLWML